jgi:hypothetical protein
MSPVIFRSFLAIAAGFLLLSTLIGITSVLFRKFVPAWSDPENSSRPAMAANLLPTCLYTALGGALTAFLAPRGALAHALMLALVTLVFSAISAFYLPAKFPLSYRLAIIALPPMAALGGGILEALIR